MALPRTIAIDGPASSGKSSVSFAVAQDLHYLFVDTGAFYRGVTLAAIRAELTNAHEAALVALAEHCTLDITPDLDTDGRQYTLLLDSEDVTWEIRQPSVESHVSRIAAVGGVREVLNRKYRTLAEHGCVIMVGRDIGTVVLPNADLKIYLDASVEARATRRSLQRVAAGEQADYDEILAAMRQRDALDSQRAVAPLTQAADAHYLDTSHLDVDGVIKAIKQLIVA
ncbi:MAG: (d)CMP kinase [Chloroflexota bacterium]